MHSPPPPVNSTLNPARAIALSNTGVTHGTNNTLPMDIEASQKTPNTEITIDTMYLSATTRQKLHCIYGFSIYTFWFLLLLLFLAFINTFSAQYHPWEPPLSGILPGVNRPHIILAQDIDYPPYAFLDLEKLSVDGVGYDIASQLHKVCDIDVTVVETRWKNCWNAGEIGQGLLNGHYHGCMTYTHTAGQRNRFVEFSEPILDLNKPSGLLVRLDAAGKPLLKGTVSDLKDKKIVDVVGWAPTADGLYLVENTCAATPTKFSNIKYVDATYAEAADVEKSLKASGSGSPNDNALLTMLSGDADAVFIYADQAKNYKCDATQDQTKFNCHLWDDGATVDGVRYEGFGKPNGKYSTRRRSNVVVIIVKIVLSNQNPNSITNFFYIFFF